MRGLCDGCGLPFGEGQGRRFETISPFRTFHDDCWPHVCCGECGYDPAYGKAHGIESCYDQLLRDAEELWKKEREGRP